MNEDYGKRLLAHEHAVNAVAWDLLNVAQRLCPGTWVLQITTNIDTKTNEHIFLASVSNGDDNVTGQGKTISAALAELINYLLKGSVFPLAGGNSGQYIHPSDWGWVRETEKDGEG